MAAFVAKQMVGNKLNAVKGKYNVNIVENSVKITNAPLVLNIPFVCEIIAKKAGFVGNETEAIN